jgi:hypothetical protein
MKTSVTIRDIDGEKMNTHERAFYALLSAKRKDGVFQSVHFESIRLVLAEHRCTYTPDFICIMADGSITAYEVKGFWRDDARVKIKVAARLFPWIKFVAVQQRKKKDWAAQGRWKYEEF